MDSKMMHILETIINSFQKDIRNIKVGTILEREKNYHNVKCSDEYNNYTVEQFLVLYKITYMKDLGIITEDVAKSLIRIYTKKLELNRRIGDIAYKNLYNEDNNLKEIQLLYEKVAKIDEILSKYHLIIREEDIEKNILINIENEDYSDIKSDEIKELIKTL